MRQDFPAFIIFGERDKHKPSRTTQMYKEMFKYVQITRVLGQMITLYYTGNDGITDSCY